MGGPAHSRPPPDRSARAAAALIVDAFDDYNGRFADVTRRAQRCFERRDWRRAQTDAETRIDLYEVCIRETLGRLDALLDERVRSRSLWAGIRAAFAALTRERADGELYRTYFNSLSRRFFRTEGVDPRIEFTDPGVVGDGGDASRQRRIQETPGVDLSGALRELLAAQPFAARYADLQGDADALATALRSRWARQTLAPVRAIEILRTVFYRERRAYLVGRVVDTAGDIPRPLVIALVHHAGGVRADALLTDPADVSVLFGYARSYFHADLPVIADAVAFLRELMPHKPVDELYTVIGRAKQGKTERYRALYRHLAAHPEERLVAAEGTPGMVMQVFTPRDYPVVFKVIRDHFAWPKDSGRRQVEAKYRLVFRRDRAGRLVDAQDFRRLRFDRAQFEPALLQDLLDTCATTVSVDGDDVVIAQCYVERRLRPLDVFVRGASEPQACRALLDYGQAIKDLARSGIFPGDLLLKNFGLSRNGRAVFYDYDELCTIDECHFRVVPEAREEDETRPLEEWLYAAPADVFPELFPRFLGVTPALRQVLRAEHGEIFDPRWWQDVQARLLSGTHLDVPPYPSSTRLRGVDI